MPIVSKTLQYSFCACVRNILKIVMFVIEKMKLVSFSLFVDAFPPRPKMTFGQLNVIILIYNMCKGRLGSRGERGCISKRRHQSSDKNRPLCKMVVFIVHQLYRYIYNILYRDKCRTIVYLSLTVYFPHMLLNSEHS